MATQGSSGRVYVIKQEPNGPYKVGLSIHPKERLIRIQRLNPNLLTLVQVLEGDYYGSKIERRMHNYLMDYQVIGEWFDVTPAQIQKAIDFAFSAPNKYVARVPRRLRAKTYEGKMCKHGHIERYLSNRRCVECSKSQAKEKRQLDPDYHVDYQRNWKRNITIKQATPAWANPTAIERVYVEKDALEKKMRMNFEVTYIIPLKHKMICGLHTAENMEVSSISHRNLKGRRFNSLKESKGLLKQLKDAGL